MKPLTSNLPGSWGLPKPIIKSHPEKSGRGFGLGVLPKISEFPFNISATAEAIATSNLACSWGLPRAITESYSEGKSAWLV